MNSGVRFACYMLIGLLLWLIFKPARADDTWLVTTVHSYHYDRSPSNRRCESNWGVGAEHHVSNDWSLHGGMYRNSYCRGSAYLGTGWFPVHRGTVHFGITAGIVNGYRQEPFGGYLIPTVSIQDKRWGVNIGIVPSLDSAFTVIGVQLKYRIR